MRLDETGPSVTESSDKNISQDAPVSCRVNTILTTIIRYPNSRQLLRFHFASLTNNAGQRLVTTRASGLGPTGSKDVIKITRHFIALLQPWTRSTQRRVTQQLTLSCRGAFY